MLGARLYSPCISHNRGLNAGRDWHPRTQAFDLRLLKREYTVYTLIKQSILVGSEQETSWIVR